jgi:nucleoid-associated protein YgaU
MRLVLILCTLACAFALAAMWQEQKLAELRRERQLASRVSAGVLVETPSGALPAGKGVVIIGRPSGAEPLEMSPAEQAPEQAGSGADPRAEPGAELADFVMEVRAGQTLSGIAHAVYGTAPSGLVRRLAEYNGLEDPDMLRAGQRLCLPPRERLE